MLKLVFSASLVVLAGVTLATADSFLHDILFRVPRGTANQPTEKGVCHYAKRAKWSDCDHTTRTKTRVLRLKKKRSDKACVPSQTQTKRCKVPHSPVVDGQDVPNKNLCRYQRTANSTWSACDTVKVTKTLTKYLAEPAPASCAPTQLVRRPCRHENKRRRKKQNRKRHRQRQKKARHRRKNKKAEKRPVCKYDFGNWTSCGPDSLQSRTLTLRNGSDVYACHVTRILRRRCREEKPNCKYSRGEWGVCNAKSSVKIRILTLQPGSSPRCKLTKVMKRRCKPKKRKKKVCRYEKGTWSECDENGLKNRTDSILVKTDSCDPVRTVTRRCKSKKRALKCQYSFGTWSECVEGERTRTQIRTSDPSSDTPASPCPATRRIVKKCVAKSGKERCFFGKWGKLGPCQNGARTKIRPVIAGGDHCHRKAVKTRPCHDS